MPSPSCSRCSAPLSMAAAQGGAPCATCGTVNAPFVNPYASPQGFGQGPMFGNDAPPGALPWICGACRHENNARYEFCLGCGGARTGPSGRGAHGHGGERREPVRAQPKSPVVVIVVAIVAVLVALGVAGGVAFFFLAR